MREGHGITNAVSGQNALPKSDKVDTAARPRWTGILPNNRPMFFANVKVMKDDEKLRTCHRLKETEGDTSVQCHVRSWTGSWEEGNGQKGRC